MIIELKIPSPGESITEVEIANWLIEDGDFVEKDQEIAEVESDKATLPLIAPESGKVKILVSANETISVGSVACKIDTEAKGKPAKKTTDEKQEKETGPEKAKTAVKAGQQEEREIEYESEETEQGKKNAPPEPVKAETEKKVLPSAVKVTPLAQKIMEDNNLSVDDIINGLKKITTKEVNAVLSAKPGISESRQGKISREVQRTKMTQLRKKLGKRLVAVRQETAMLTTFNEVDMSSIISLRKKYQQKFLEKFGIKLGFMSFFVKAATEALKIYPRVNSMIDGEEIVTPDYVDICIAVQTEKGLMVPVVRNTESMPLAQIEKEIAELADKARNFTISIEEMTGGTFTITNGGVFGSMLSTPIINPPQSAILGMHNITERPVAINGKIEIRPVMYLALSYDHRLIDGKDSVSFLVKVKEIIENPVEMLLEGQNPEKLLLGL